MSWGPSKEDLERANTMAVETWKGMKALSDARYEAGYRAGIEAAAQWYDDRGFHSEADNIRARAETPGEPRE